MLGPHQHIHKIRLLLWISFGYRWGARHTRTKDPAHVPRRTDLTPRKRKPLPAHENGRQPARPSQPLIASPGREAIPVSTACAPEGAAAPDGGSAFRPCRFIPFPMEAWVAPLPRGCPRPESLLPESSTARSPFRRGTARPGVAPVAGPPGTRAFLTEAPKRPACPWGDTRTRNRRRYGRKPSPRPVTAGP